MSSCPCCCCLAVFPSCRPWKQNGSRWLIQVYFGVIVLGEWASELVHNNGHCTETQYGSQPFAVEQFSAFCRSLVTPTVTSSENCKARQIRCVQKTCHLLCYFAVGGLLNVTFLLSIAFNKFNSHTRMQYAITRS